MRVLITGAGGFLGRATVSAFLRHGHDVRALVRPAAELRGLPTDGVEVVRADLRAGGNLVAVVNGVDAVVHLAAGTSGDEADMFGASVVGTERLLTAMASTTTRRLVLASSFTVYDWNAASQRLTETSPMTTELEQRGGYTAAKVWQERVSRRMSAEHDFDLTVLRPGVIWGPGGESPPGITQQMGRVHLVFGRSARLPLTYVENCAECFVHVTESPESVGETFNVVDDAGTPTAQFLRERLRRSGVGGMVVVVPYTLAEAAVRVVSRTSEAVFGRPGHLPSIFVPARFVARFKPLAYSNDRLRDIVGWEPTYSFAEALDRTYGPPRPAVPSSI